eukprot:TRINITY_DN113665_c0_g1_i1.p1 TRINITY_DN113665_c0_g1~~TRINITY_DN113665_c0_g1_i1.p1  ORF type:complete len:156 (-),score=31.17 TRINITY_DN113665_c0_g1_i1:52-519(-)
MPSTTWQELRERASDGLTPMINPEVKEPTRPTLAVLNSAVKAPYPVVLPPPDPPLAFLFPDPKEPHAPLRCASVWGSIGAGLGVLRGISFAVFSETGPMFTKPRAFATGFFLAAPWYITFFALAGFTDCMAARTGESRLVDKAQACGALGAGELG